jgi:hypothetical protein
VNKKILFIDIHTTEAMPLAFFRQTAEGETRKFIIKVL